jgi:hypothetical protein
MLNYGDAGDAIPLYATYLIGLEPVTKHIIQSA